MNYVIDYLKAIDKGKEIVGQKVHAVYQREVEWIKKPPKDFPFYFDEEMGLRPIYFMDKFFKNYKGISARKP
ncbi:MAG: terminase large subunit, partial [Candidatus Bathyarchaeota archaeon]|nr:terminase large subunit [Candidatus Bathyarchaeum sp.]